MSIKRNLYAALKRLRYGALDRILWVDAICINQGDDEEKNLQVRSMARIYAYATRVVVWLEEATENHPLLGDDAVTTDSDAALEALRLDASGQGASRSPFGSSRNDHLAIMHMLERSWFQHVWVLQEVAAARHIIVASRSSEMDGYAFSVGLEKTLLVRTPPAEDAPSDEPPPDQANPLGSLTYLMKGAVHRAKRPAKTMLQKRFYLDIPPLAALLDLYHARKATDQRDRVFALIGLGSDHEDLFHRLANSLVSTGAAASVGIQAKGPIAIIRAKGWAAGVVVNAERGETWDTVHVEIESPSTPNEVFHWSSREGLRKWSKAWREDKRLVVFGKRPRHSDTIRAAPGSIRDGDIACLLQGSSALTILRSCSDYCIVILIGAHFVDDDDDDGTQRLLEEHAEGLVPRCPSPVARLMDMSLIWADVGLQEDAYEQFRKAVDDLASGLPPENTDLLLALDSADNSEAEITEAVLRAAAGNTDTDAVQMIGLLLHYASDAKSKVTDEVVLAAAMNERHGPAVMAFLINHPDLSINKQIPEPVFVAAAQTYGRDLSEFFERNSSRLEVTEQVVEAAISRCSGKDRGEAVECGGPGITITENLLVAAAMAGVEPVMKLLFDRCGDSLRIPKAMLVTVASSYRRRIEGRRPPEFKVDQAVVENAASDGDGRVIKLLLSQPGGGEFSINEAVFNAAAGNTQQGDQVMEVLLNRYGAEIQITGAVVEAHEATGRKKTLELLLDRRGHEVKISRGAMKAAASNTNFESKALVEFILAQRPLEAEIDEEVLMAVAKNDSYQHSAAQEQMVCALVSLLLCRCQPEVITQKVIKAAIGNRMSGNAILALLLDGGAGVASITTDVLTVAAGNEKYSAGMVAMFLDKQHGRMQNKEIGS
ncbi:heterokaryon incompatibility protein-domain-containing protein [Lasiosphaeria ovina]|uniref:Heterokaryon incompatibility protein-domain-containing protein n=1 Tax=Lasiosphaeria ovina TaxID=92902 RepID=A0AAE0JXP2_9PEZI|nr:heterokaryon incompatibility protein-domain-containing protein [Lasiosphaeria ovina]